MSLLYLQMYHLMKKYIFASSRVVFPDFPKLPPSVSQNILDLVTQKIQKVR